MSISTVRKFLHPILFIVFLAFFHIKELIENKNDA